MGSLNEYPPLLRPWIHNFVGRLQHLCRTDPDLLAQECGYGRSNHDQHLRSDFLACLGRTAAFAAGGATSDLAKLQHGRRPHRGARPSSATRVSRALSVPVSALSWRSVASRSSATARRSVRCKLT